MYKIHIFIDTIPYLDQYDIIKTFDNFQELIDFLASFDSSNMSNHRQYANDRVVVYVFYKNNMVWDRIANYAIA